MKLPEIVTNIKEILYNNRVSNSERLDDRQIIYWINEQRSLWLRREYNQMREIKNNEKQIIYNLELQSEDVDITDPILMKNDFTLLRSTVKIPRTIQTHLNDGITAIRGLNKLSEAINYTDRESVLYKGNGVFNSKSIFAFKDDDYIWIKYGPNSDRTRLVKNIQVEGVFENPLEVDIINDTPNEIRFGESEYPISSAFILFLESEILKIHIQRFVADGQANDEEDTNRIN